MLQYTRFIALSSAFLCTTLVILSFSNYSKAQPLAYIPNQGDNSVSIIDTSTNTVIDTVNIGNSPAGITISPDGCFVYVTNPASDNISVIDTSKNTVVDTVNVGAFPFGIAIMPDGSFVYVSNANSHDISVIDTSTNNVVDTISIGISGPWGIAVSPNGSFVYASNSFDEILVIDTTSNMIVDSINLGFNAFPDSQVLFSPDGDFVYVAESSAGNTFSVIDTSTNTVVDTVAVGTSATGIAVTPNGSFVYVTNYFSNNVSVIETSTYTVIDTIAVTTPGGISVTPDGEFVYVTSFEANTVSVINTTTNTIVDTASTGIMPIAFGVFIAPEVTYLLKALNPSEAGKQNNLTAVKATPGGDVTFIWGFTEQIVTANNICPGLQAGILNPRILTTVTADDTGTATLNVNVPLSFIGVSVVVQAVDIITCTGSNVNQESISTPSPPRPPFLAPLAPGTAGTINSIRVTDTTPNGQVRLIWGFNGEPGTDGNSICAGLQVGIMDFNNLTTITANGAGVATFNVNVPANLSGASVLLQAVDISSCTESNVNNEIL